MGWFGRKAPQPAQTPRDDAIWLAMPRLGERHVIVSYDDGVVGADPLRAACRDACEAAGLTLAAVESVDDLAPALSAAQAGSADVILIADFDSLAGVVFDVEGYEWPGGARIERDQPARYVIGTGQQDGEILAVLESGLGHVEASIMEHVDAGPDGRPLAELLSHALSAR